MSLDGGTVSLTPGRLEGAHSVSSFISDISEWGGGGEGVKEEGRGHLEKIGIEQNVT
jgi:hypothetical protein